LPEAGEYVEVQDEKVLLGGEAANTANALTYWGDEIYLAGNPVGNSSEASLLADLIKAKGLNYFPMGSYKMETPVCEIYVTPDGDRTMFGRGFSAMDDHIDIESLPWQKGAWFTAEPNMLKSSRRAAAKAHEESMNLYLMDFIKADDPIHPGSFWQSSTDWAGHRDDAQRNIHWVEEFVSRHGCFAILSDGPRGFVAGSKEHPVHAYPPFAAQVVVDTTGAGDMFRAGMLHGLSNGWELPNCLRFAAAAGCLKCRHLGANVVVPEVQEIEALIEQNPAVARQYD
jgi:sugar/nucleoside kinase (ribokinase family)